MGYLYTKPIKGQQAVKTSPFNVGNELTQAYTDKYGDLSYNLFNPNYKEFDPYAVNTPMVPTGDRNIAAPPQYNLKSGTMPILADLETPNINVGEIEPIEPTLKYKTQGSLEHQANPFKLGDIIDSGAVVNMVGTLAKLGLNATNVAINRSKIKKAAELARKSEIPNILPEFREVSALKDIPQEVLAEEKKRIANVISDYKGSDPIMRAISNMQVEQEKSRMEGELSKNRAITLLSERARIDEQKAQNQVAAVRAANEMSKIKADERARVRDVNVQEQEALRDLATKSINQSVALIDTAAGYNLAKGLKDKEMALESIDAYLNRIYSLPEVEQLNYRDQISDLEARKASLMKQIYPSYGKMLSGAFYTPKNW